MSNSSTSVSGRLGPGILPSGFYSNELKTRVPRAEEFTMLDPRVLRVIVEIAQALSDVTAKWAIAGDAGEAILGVNIPAKSVAILAVSAGTDDEINRVVQGYCSGHPSGSSLSGPISRAVELERMAESAGVRYPVRISSWYSEARLEDVQVQVHSDLRVKVGEWEWGDTLDFEPAYACLVGKKVPVLPLRLKSDLYFGLGWIDRVEKIQDAMHRSLQHL